MVLATSGRYVYYLFAGNPLWPVETVRHVAERLYEALFAAVIVPLFAMGMLASLRRWRTPLVVPALLYLALFLAVWIFKSELRLRVPFDAITMIYASFGTAIAWNLLHARYRSYALRQRRDTSAPVTDRRARAARYSMPSDAGTRCARQRALHSRRCASATHSPSVTIIS